MVLPDLDLMPGMFVDALDKEDIWNVARIKRVHSNVKVSQVHLIQ